MNRKTVTCPNGCDPSGLEREHWYRVESEKNAADWLGIPTGTRYLCRWCGWEADWNPRQGLMVTDEGRLGPIYDQYN